MKEFIIDAVLKEAAYDYLDQYRPAVLKEIQQHKSPEEIYVDLCLNSTHVPNEIEKILEGFEKENKVQPGFTRKFYEIGKQYREKKQFLVAKVGNFEVYDYYKVSETHSTNRAKIVAMLKEVINLMNAKGYGFLVYGKIHLTNPSGHGNIATYNYGTDEIQLKVYRDDNSHAVGSMIHELAHRMWHKLFTYEDQKKWEDEFNAKKMGKPEKELVGELLGRKFYKTVQLEGFPSLYAQTKDDSEYFAEVVRMYIVDNKKYSDLLDEIY